MLFVRKRNSDSISADGHNGTLLESGRLFFEQPLHEIDTLLQSNIRQPQEARVGVAFLEDELTEVLVHCDEDAPFVRGPFENDFVSRVLAPL